MKIRFRVQRQLCQMPAARVDPAQLLRLAGTADNLITRIAEAPRTGLDRRGPNASMPSLPAARHKLADLDRLAARHKLADLDRLAARRTIHRPQPAGISRQRRPNHHRKGRIMTDTDLTAALRAHARGLHTRKAAIELLIGHASWLRRTDFVDPFVHTATGLIDGTPMASIDWAAAITALNDTHLPCSGSEGRILRLAASLAHAIPVDLQDALTGLDDHNTALTLAAVERATGHR